jgi:DNA-binding CsgD family transcriptional regulator/tetratricopeptide (TPR) repeat protein
MLVSRAGLSPVMVERDAEFAELRRLFGTVVPGMQHPPVVIVSGEAGVGKTRLLRELADEVVRSGGCVLAGRAEESSLAPPFGALRDALQSVVSSWEGDVPGALAGREHPLRHVLSPLLVEHDPAEQHEHAADELLRAAVDCVTHVVGARRTLLLFEDLHWADAESNVLFTRLASTPGLPVLLVGTFRPEDFDRRHPLAQALPALERQQSVLHLSLCRLSERALARMLEAVFERPVPTASVVALHRRTQGNPFFVEELVAGCGCADPAELAIAPLPWNAAEAVLRRVDELEPLAARVLSTAALLGSRVPFDLLRAVVDVSEDELIDALHVLVDRGLLTEADTDMFAFRHALTREAVASRLLGREQRRIHQAALEILEDQGSDDILALAHRAAGAGRWDKLVRYACEGVTRLLREGSALQALQLAEQGLARAEVVTPEDEIVLRSAAAHASWHLGLTDVSQHHTEQWRLLAVEEKLVADEAAALRHESTLRWEAGDRDRYWQAVRRAREVAAQLGPSPDLAWGYAFESQAHMLDGDPDAAVALADQALEMAGAVGAPEVRPWALVNKGMVLTESVTAEQQGLELLEEAAEESLDRGDVMAALRALNNALVHYIHRRPDPAPDTERLLAQARALADRYGIEPVAWKMAQHALALTLKQGDMASAQAVLDDAPATSGSHQMSLDAARLFLAAERDDTDEILRLAAWRRVDDPGCPAEMLVWWQVARLQGAARARSRDVAEDAFANIEALILGDGTENSRAQHSCESVLAGLPAGIAGDRLAGLLERAASEAPPGRHSMFDPAWKRHGQAALDAASGRHDEAAQGYRAALTGMRFARPAWLVADANAGLARSLAALGQRAAAAEAAECAASLLDGWPGWRLADAEQLARRLRGRGEAQGGGHGLTPREQEVLVLIADGLSNRQIAEKLYIATKTVAVHVSNILAKTGAASRTEAAAWGLRTGAVPAPKPAVS